jgi:hypothetical protein
MSQSGATPPHDPGSGRVHSGRRHVNHIVGRWPGVAAALVMLCAGPACNVVGPSACTLIGCTGLVVEVTGAAGQTPVTVVVTAPDGSTRSATCTTATGTCPVSFLDFTPASLTVRVSSGNQSTELTVQPAYQLTRPNGPECPPECRSARVTVGL